MQYQDIYEFWFVTCSEQDWWQKSSAFDQKVKSQFSILHKMAYNGELEKWRETPVGSLCEIIVLDQFPRNMYRDTPQAFASDALALSLSQQAIDKGFDKALNDTEVGFLYMPFMHSESAVIHRQAEVLFRDLPGYEFELAHKRIIDRFGRYPHRNNILGRVSTDEELEFLQQPGSSF
ncbi:DUF924 family protein [Pseudoalteromonas luteoviolacea]|uniref:Membrane protein n=1 Tax=Pseudoalteromonas luteoviolacea S4054 TaxID=1129367 RepID=A0A0F6AEV2_9GAMM|nr:DUF924 family protein [Pseudoalteromonas luteoviolacea]AOT08431.1 hypothetical protein S4054249_11500 [Pseudoalteromonas luteoviolacea]AOT13347.1 hypothetical protein S40542_11475 [Pseudoalteromonas luteoviolacea]AOT18260.1 hypothetical protein S4054_11475 [Pseudoalteromonas luteoviolacea]KKE84752.1 membrane protein [Pseudoalteromonas luteoviolacea S4054]KZN76011.1 membrane protein [Pseudoalteromonas luteoviolacea S4047-1]